MIALLQGKIIENKNSELLIMTSGGVGYRINASLSALKKFQVNQEAHIETYLVVREDALELFGFADTEEKHLFQHLLQVSGIGPKTSLHVLSLGSVMDISQAIARGDVTYLTKVSGIGKKTAERMVVELKTKMETFGSGGLETGTVTNPGTTALNDVMAGLEALGYSGVEAREVIQKLDAQGKTSEQLLREALQMMR
jgi:Holliday junction DNA helicase RuvA